MTVGPTKIIAVTGTKGKTSVTRMLHHALQSVHDEPVLAVDTHRIMLGDQKYATFSQSVATAGLSPTVSPGRFLLALKDSAHPIAVLEASVGSSRAPGLGYKSHKVGIFTNVYDDHLGVKAYLQTREDLAKAKSFIFSQISRGGVAVFNADDELVTEQALIAVANEPERRLVACTLDTEYKAPSGVSIVATVDGNDLVLRRDGEDLLRTPIAGYPWLFGGAHIPSIYNALSVMGGLWGMYEDPAQVIKAFSSLMDYMPDEAGSRMVVKTSSKGAKVIIDFAHEAESLTQIAKFAKTMTAHDGKVIGVIRLSRERPDAHIISTTSRVAPYYDSLVIYDKKEHLATGTPVSELMYEAALDTGVEAAIVKDERAALVAAHESSKPGDVIVYIVGSSVGTYEQAREICQFKEDTV